MKLEAMLWVVILVSLALAIVSPKYRKHGAMVIGVAVAAIVAVIVFARKDDVPAPAPASVPAQHSKPVDFERLHVDKLDEADPRAKDRIGIAEIRFDQVRPSVGAEPGTFESIRARLYNDSANFALTDYGYYLAVQDCIAATCTTIYEQRGIESATVPAHQARDVTIALRDGEVPGSVPFKLLGTPKILLRPAETRAYEASSTP